MFYMVSESSHGRLAPSIFLFFLIYNYILFKKVLSVKGIYYIFVNTGILFRIIDK